MAIVNIIENHRIKKMVALIIKNLKRFITTIFAVIALFISIKSCSISNKSQITAEKALELSQEQFLQINKPYMTLKPKKFPNDTYLKIERKENIVFLELQFELRNLGNVSAINIHAPKRAAMNKNIFVPEGGVFEFNNKLPQNTILSPNDSVVLNYYFEVTQKDINSAKKFINDIYRDEGKFLTLLCPINYQSELDKDTNFCLIKEYMIKPNSARIVKSETKSFYNNAGFEESTQ